MEIRPAQPDELTALAAFLSAEGMPRSENELAWKYFRTPGQGIGKDRSLVAEIDGRLVGHIGVVPTRICGSKNRDDLTAGWFVDWMVAQDVRARGIGIFLLREMAKHCEPLMTIQGSAETQAALPQLHWCENRRLGIYKLNVRKGALGKGSGRLRATASEIARVLRFHPIQHAAPSGWRCDGGSDASESAAEWRLLDAALRRQRQSPNGRFCHCWRSGEFLRWSLRDHPRHRYRALVAYERDTPAGYAIWRPSTQPDGRVEGRIVDVGVPWDRLDVWRWLVSEVTARLVAEGVVQTGCLAGTASPLAHALQANRYLLRQTLPLWVSPHAHASNHETPWHLTYADSDIDTAAEA